MSYKQVPITAKILKTTKGGITQPLLNMGAPVKMKASSPAKVNPNTDAKDFKSKYDAREKSKADAAAQAVIAKKASDLSSYKKNLSQYRKDILNSDNAAKTPDGPGVGANASRGKIMKGVSNKKAETKRISDFENNLYNYDKKNKPGSTKNYDTAKKYALAKASGTYKSKDAVNDPPVNDPPVNDPPVNDLTKNKKSYDQAYKDRDQKTYGKMDKATYIKEAKRQNASKKAGKGWDASGKGKTINISNNGSTSNTVEPTPKVTKKQEATQSAKNNVAGNTKKKVNTKVTVKPTSGQVRRNASADRKDSRAKRVSVKAEEARASGNTTKADRLDRRVGRIKKRANKKRGQATGAIQPK